MYGRDSWTIKKAEHWRTDTLGLWCWRRLLTVPWTARRAKQSILKESNPENSLEGLKLKLQHSGHLMKRANSLGKTQMLGKIEDRKKKEWQNEMVGWYHRLMSLSKHWEIMKNWEAWHAAVHGGTKSWTWLNDWTRTLLTSSVLDIVNIICSN